MWIAGLNNDAEQEKTPAGDGQADSRLIGDPTETALLAAAIKAGVTLPQLYQAYPRVQEVPFDATRKRMVIVHALVAPQKADASPFDESQADGFAVLVKGAPDMVLNLCRYYQRVDDTIAP